MVWEGAAKSLKREDIEIVCDVIMQNILSWQVKTDYDQWPSGAITFCDRQKVFRNFESSKAQQSPLNWLWDNLAKGVCFVDEFLNVLHHG